MFYVSVQVIRWITEFIAFLNNIKISFIYLLFIPKTQLLTIILIPPRLGFILYLTGFMMTFPTREKEKEIIKF